MFTYDGGEDPPERITDDAMRAAFVFVGAVGAAAVAAMIAVSAFLPGFPIQLFAVAVAVGGAGAAVVMWRQFKRGITTLDVASYKKAKEAGDS